MGEITGLLGKVHQQRTLGLAGNPTGEFYPMVLHLNPLGNGVDVGGKVECP